MIMSSDYRSINNIKSQAAGSSDSSTYRPGSYVDSVANDLRIEAREREYRSKYTTCYNCRKFKKRRIILTDFIPGIKVHDFKIYTCEPYMNMDLDKLTFPKLNCAKGDPYPPEERKMCTQCEHCIESKAFDVSTDGKTANKIMLYKCIFDASDLWCRNYYNCVRFKRKKEKKQ